MARADNDRAPGLAAIAAHYRDTKLDEELRGNWVNVVAHRVPSFFLIWLLTRLGVGPMAVTVASAIVALPLPALAAWLPLPAAALSVFAAGFLFQVLDCTDGALARLTGSTSRLGGDFDFLIDMAQWALLYAAIGLLADRTLGGAGEWTALALGAGWIRLFARAIRDRMTPEPTEEPASAPLKAADLPVVFFAGLSGGLCFLALAGSLLGYGVVFLLAYAVLDLGETLVGVARRLLA